ncbi:hypothetical protein FRC19_010232 [Serendipita sp. 401]|nr:hypothetical protein FRC15_001897 [Serendipita sp. 397]KAG8825895.1 hypothetical protein FRC19_010232 [Serendipita sp. 401]KAG8845275.1 hypothetical protein FRC20_003262 [Serendipita sp. 405]
MRALWVAYQMQNYCVQRRISRALIPTLITNPLQGDTPEDIKTHLPRLLCLYQDTQYGMNAPGNQGTVFHSPHEQHLNVPQCAFIFASYPPPPTLPPSPSLASVPAINNLGIIDSVPMSATLTALYHIPLSHRRLPSAPGANIAQNSSNANANVGGPMGATNTANPPSEPSPPVGGK